MRSLLILDMSFTMKMIKERQLEQVLDIRKLDDYFSRVISIHPLAGLFEVGDKRFGKPIITRWDDSHVFVEGKIGISKYLWFFPALNLIFAQVALIKLLLILGRDAKVDIIRVGDPYYLGIMGWVLSRLLKVPLAIRVCFNYDQLHKTVGKAVFPKLFRFRFIEKMIERFIFPRCALVAGANQNNLNYAFENGADPDNGVVFRYGNLIYPLHFSNPESRGEIAELLAELDIQGDYLATVSRLEKMKQPEQNLLVMKSLVDSGCEFKFIFIGDGSMRSYLEGITEELGLQDYIIFAGNRSQDWIAKILPSARLVLSPHMGRGLTEACLAGVPIVAYDYDWQGEVIRSGETGELVSEGDWQEMALKARYLLDNPVLAKKMGQQARRLVMKMMSPETLTSIEVASYDALFNNQ